MTSRVSYAQSASTPRGGGAKSPLATSNTNAAPTAKPVTPPKTSSTPKSTKKRPNAAHPEMTVDKRIIDELLLVCGVIGSTSISGNDQGEETFVPVTDCLNWLQDLQRALRRDHDTYRPIGLLLGQWRVVSQKLLPLVVSCKYDRALVLTICKILVILTKPLSEGARRAGRMVVDVKSGKVDDSVIQEQIVLRENAIAQSDLLVEYKKLFVRHPTHHYVFQNSNSNSNNNNATKKSHSQSKDSKRGSGLLSIFTALLAEPLSKTGSARSSSDHLTIELVLHLFRNLLSISPLNTFGSSEKAQQAMTMHRELIVLLQEEMVLDVLTVLGQEVESRENSGYNLLLMEILHHLLRSQDPSDVALSANESPTPSLPTTTSKLTTTKKGTTRTISTTRTTIAANTSTGSNSLRAQLTAERQQLQLTAPSRHSHFGGTLLIAKPGGRQSYVSASDYLSQKDQGKTGGGGGVVQARRKNKKSEVFVGSGKSSALNARPGASATFSREVAGPITKRAKRALNTFCKNFVNQCYGPVMKSLKNEFRRDSNRLEDGDRTMFFRIVWFFHQWWRVSRKENGDTKKKNDGGVNKNGVEKDEKSAKSSAQNLIFTMDVFMFNLVFNSTDEFFEHKKPAELAQTVALLTEMIHMLHAMYESEDSTEHMMALGLMDRIFYATEPLDRLPKLLSRWSPGMFSREYLCDLVECSHVTLKLVDANAERCISSLSNEMDRKRPKDAVERMNITASEFDKDKYFMRKFVSNHIVFMHTQLLSKYAVNAAHVNRHVAAYFIRLCKFNITAGDGDLDGFDDALGKNELATKMSTLEPMLYNIGLFSVLEKILNDQSIRDNQDFSALLMFASSFMKRFARASDVNPMLFVEALFRHPIPHRFCELTTNMYVNEELKMIAVRDLLLEDQKKYEHIDAIDDEENDQRYNDDEEEELEFNEENDDDSVKVRRGQKSTRRNYSTQNDAKTADATNIEELSEEDEEEVEFNDNASVDGTPKSINVATVNNEKELEVQGDVDDGKVDKSRAYDESTPQSPIHTSVDDIQPITQGDDVSPQGMSGKKRIRKSQAAEEDSEDEDFSGPAKAMKRVIFEDDEED